MHEALIHKKESMRRRTQQFVWTVVAYSATANAARAQGLNPLPVDTIDQLVILILRAVITIGVPFLVFMFVYTGFCFVVARGDKGDLTKAKTMLWNTIAGAALVLGAKVLHEVLVGTLSQLHI